jgi:hypothetical protein
MGSNTAASQQQAQLISEEATMDSYDRRTPRQAFQQDLQAFIRQCQANGDDIILVGDFNDDITREGSGMRELASACNLVDMFAVRLGNPNHPATYQRGSKRIDYTLMSPHLLHHVHAAGYDPFGYRIPSDHRGFYIDLLTSQLFQNEVHPLAPMEKRNFSSKDPETVAKYVNAKIKYLDEHHFFDRLDKLNESSLPDNILAETLDRDYQRASNHAARICSRRKTAPWSPKLAQAWAELHFYRIARTAIKLHKNLDNAMKKLREKWRDLPEEIPKDEDAIREGYNGAMQKLREARQMASSLREEFLQKKVDMHSTNKENRRSFDG